MTFAAIDGGRGMTGRADWPLYVLAGCALLACYIGLRLGRELEAAYREIDQRDRECDFLAAALIKKVVEEV